MQMHWHVRSGCKSQCGTVQDDDDDGGSGFSFIEGTADDTEDSGDMQVGSHGHTVVDCAPGFHFTDIYTPRFTQMRLLQSPRTCGVLAGKTVCSYSTIELTPTFRSALVDLDSMSSSPSKSAATSFDFMSAPATSTSGPPAPKPGSATYDPFSGLG